MSVENVIPETRQIVRVPDLPWHELVTSAARKLGRARIHPYLLKEDLYRGERGRTYEALAWEPGHVIHGSDVHSRFKDLGFDGNPAVFVVWTMSSTMPASRDRYITIPDQDRVICHKGMDDLAPCLLRGYRAIGWGCSLTLSRVFKPMHTVWTFVSFREVEAPLPG